MEYRTIVIFLEDGMENSSKIGFVRAKDGVSYMELREEIENDELEEIGGCGFVFLADKKLPLSKKQEERFKVVEADVLVKLIDGASNQPSKNIDRESSQPIKRPRLIIEDLEEEASPLDEMVEVVTKNIRPTPCEGKLQSKLATKFETNKWKKDPKYYTTKLRNVGRKDRFELRSEDVNGKPVFYLWCIECSLKYGRGGQATMYNFTAKHCFTESHLENYHRHNGDANMVNEVKEAPEDIVERNKALVEQCLLTDVTPFVQQSGVFFELYQDSIAGYKDLGGICIVCKLCNKSLLLFPTAGSIVTNMKQHIMSSRHIQNTAAKETKERKSAEQNKGGRPPKNQSDPRQKSMLAFISQGTNKENVSGMDRNKGKAKVT